MAVVVVDIAKAEYRRSLRARQSGRVEPKPDDTSWIERGACRGKDTELFFPTRGEPVEEARAICARCPVARECLEYALGLAHLAGMWGGKSEKERTRMRRQRRTRSNLVNDVLAFELEIDRLSADAAAIIGGEF